MLLYKKVSRLKIAVSKGIRIRTTSLSVSSYVKALARLLRLFSLALRCAAEDPKSVEPSIYVGDEGGTQDWTSYRRGLQCDAHDFLLHLLASLHRRHGTVHSVGLDNPMLHRFFVHTAEDQFQMLAVTLVVTHGQNTHW